MDRWVWNECWWTRCPTRGFLHDAPASGQAMIPDGNYREAGARHLRSAKTEDTGKGSVTVNETLPPWACHGLRAAKSKTAVSAVARWRRANGANAKEAATAKCSGALVTSKWCQCERGSDCKAHLARQRECRGGRSLDFSSTLRVPNCRTLALDGTDGLQDKVGSAIIHFEGLAGLWDHQEQGTPELRRITKKNNDERSTAIVTTVPICVAALMAMV